MGRAVPPAWLPTAAMRAAEAAAEEDSGKAARSCGRASGAGRAAAEGATCHWPNSCGCTAVAAWSTADCGARSKDMAAASGGGAGVTALAWDALAARERPGPGDRPCHSGGRDGSGRWPSAASLGSSGAAAARVRRATNGMEGRGATPRLWLMAAGGATAAAAGRRGAGSGSSASRRPPRLSTEARRKSACSGGGGGGGGGRIAAGVGGARPAALRAALRSAAEAAAAADTARTGAAAAAGGAASWPCPCPWCGYGAVPPKPWRAEGTTPASEAAAAAASGAGLRSRVTADRPSPVPPPPSPESIELDCVRTLRSGEASGVRGVEAATAAPLGRAEEPLPSTWTVRGRGMTRCKQR